MIEQEVYKGGENFDLRKMLLVGRAMTLKERVSVFDVFMQSLQSKEEALCMRCITSAADREVAVADAEAGVERRMIMFGSNNYLGLANHPHVLERAAKALREYGAGIGGPPLLNGYTGLHRELEGRLAALKGTEDAMIFSSGYGANVGLVTGLVNSGDLVLYDTYSHASFCDGLKMAGVNSFHFPHNNIDRLRFLLEKHAADHQDIFVGVEGVYSMDGDLAPLDTVLLLCNSYGATLIVDDAHGTGVMGPTGRGTAEHFGLEGEVPVTMGTFSKTFAVTGGFVAASRPIITYLRYFARAYMFSASLSPVTIATVLAGLDVLEREPERLALLRQNVRLLAGGLRARGFACSPQAAIIPLRVPPGMDIRRAALGFHRRGIFVNSIEYPAVPVSQQRFRISVMSTHTKEDIHRLLTAVEEIWAEFGELGSQSGLGMLAA